MMVKFPRHFERSLSSFVKLQEEEAIHDLQADPATATNDDAFTSNNGGIFYRT